jgi:hypothetical protein
MRTAPDTGSGTVEAAAENLGYAKVVLEETIAQGAAGCRVTVYLKPLPDTQRIPGREYFAG